MKNVYINLLCDSCFGENMRKHFEKKIDFVVELENGDLMAFDKPNIKTNFCYSYDEYQDHQIGTDTYKEAAEQASKGPSKAAFFRENLQDINYTLENLNEACYYITQLYYRGPANIVGFCYKPDSDGREITENELKILKDAVLLQKKHFEKRLENYWKRFGSSKLKCWSYSVND